MSHIYIPITTVEQWRTLLADPVKHWATGYSARSLAYAWHDAKGLPDEIRLVFSKSQHLCDAMPLIVIPEHKVALPGGGRASQNDVWLLAKANDHLVSIAVEGKVSESFDKTVDEWLRDASSGKQKRLSYLQDLLCIEAIPTHLRYQLLHRTASAIIEAQRFCASHAVLLVHSFSQTHMWFDDYAAFAKCLGVEAGIDQVVYAGVRSGVHLHLAWVTGDPRYLQK